MVANKSVPKATEQARANATDPTVVARIRASPTLPSTTIDSPDSEQRLSRFQDERFFARNKFGTFEIPKDFLNMHQKAAATPKIVCQARAVRMDIDLPRFRARCQTLYHV